MDVPSPRIPVGQTKVEKGISRPKNLSSHPAGDWNKESRMWVSKHPTKYTYILYITVYIYIYTWSYGRYSAGNLYGL